MKKSTIQKAFLSMLCGVTLSLGCGAEEPPPVASDAPPIQRGVEQDGVGAHSSDPAPGSVAPDGALSPQDVQTTWVKSGEAFQVGPNVTCQGYAYTPWYSGGRTYAEGGVHCSGTTTIPATICLERDNGTTVGCFSATPRFNGWQYWWYSAAGCNSSVRYRSRFTSNGVRHLSGWRAGCQ